MVPIVQKLSASSQLVPRVCVTAQHREMLDQVLDHFNIVPDYDLDIMTKGQDIFDLTSNLMKRLKSVLEKDQPDIVLVQGDTTTAFLGSLASFYLRIPVGHIEAGLRTHQKYSPFPEEVNRHLIGSIADYHFAPTEMAQKNLLKENVDSEKVWVTGNTVIDTLLQESSSQQDQDWQIYFQEKWNFNTTSPDKKIILVTGHRRESFGKGFEDICMALKTIATNHPDVNIVYPVHLNPNVKKTVHGILGKKMMQTDNVFLIDPLEYAPFVYLMNESYLILTDSGGIQEEAPSLGKPVLVMRDTTERPEGIDAGTCKLVGTSVDRIVEETEKLLIDPDVYRSMAQKTNPYGDGKASERIALLLHQIIK